MSVLGEESAVDFLLFTHPSRVFTVSIWLSLPQVNNSQVGAEV